MSPKKRGDRYTPVENILNAELEEPSSDNSFGNTPDSASDARMGKVLKRAKTQVGTRDMLGLMLVNIWQTLAAIMAPLFKLKQQHRTTGKERENG